jgi:hypothetical protein
MENEYEKQEQLQAQARVRTAMLGGAAASASTLKTIWWAFYAILPLQALTALVLPNSYLPPSAYRFTAFGMIVVALALNFIVRLIYGNLTSEKRIERKLANLTTENTAENAKLLRSFLRSYTVWHIIVFAIYELIAALGLFLYMRGGEVLMLFIFIGGAALMIYFVRPRPNTLQAWVTRAIGEDD